MKATEYVHVGVWYKMLTFAVELEATPGEIVGEAHLLAVDGVSNTLYATMNDTQLSEATEVNDWEISEAREKAVEIAESRCGIL